MIRDEDVISESESESDVDESADKKKPSDDLSDDDDMSDFEDASEDDDSDSDSDNDRKFDDPKLAAELLMSDDDGDNEEDDLDENYLQKLDNDVNKNIIEEYHPELLAHNTEEVETACLIVRNEHGVIVDPMHRTLPFVTRYERARVIGERAKQINSGARPFVSIDATMIDGYLIALQEYEQKKIPFIIRRPMPNGVSEYWRLSDLDII